MVDGGGFRGTPVTPEREAGWDAPSPLATAWVRGVPVRPGSAVRLQPGGRADIFDLLLRGKVATVDRLEVDAEGRIFVAVIVQDDPGRELGRLGQPGHRFFYRLEEIEPLGTGEWRQE